MQASKSDIDRRRRRRRRRAQVVVIYVAIAVSLSWFFESQATTTVIFVRHAEKLLEPADDPDPGLSVAGQLRAAELARQLVDADVVAGVDAIYSTSYRRTEETVQPVADALSLPITSYDASNTETIMDEIVKKHKGQIILVVGHSNTVPALIGNMGASKKVPLIEEGEYDNMYVVSIPWFGKTKTIRLRYGAPYVPAE